MARVWHTCTARQSCHVEVNFVLVSMGDDVTRSRSIHAHDIVQMYMHSVVCMEAKIMMMLHV